MATARKAAGAKAAAAKNTARKFAAKVAEKVAAKKAAPAKKSGAKPAASPAGIASLPADIVDEQLARYREMRDFHVTAEPAGGEGQVRAAGARNWARVEQTGGLPFVIQKHAASHLHYDFRLGWNGVLKSWAVAKGPSYFVGDKRLAMQVEDHPMEYGGFEGIIPKGQYGGGTVMVWDQGTWAPQPGHEDVDEGLRKGSLKFTMDGTKMHGKWTLVRMGSRDSRGRETKPAWLLIKEHDEWERGKEDPCITEEAPNSAVTGRSLEEIAAQEDHVWNSNRANAGKDWYRQEPRAEVEVAAGSGGTKAVAPANAVAAPKKAAGERKATAGTASDAEASGASTGPGAEPDWAAAVEKLPREKQPEFVAPQLAQEAAAPPGAGPWLHELKLDGYRVQARKAGGKVQLLTRSGLDWTHRMRGVAEDVARLPAASATLDGEVVVLRDDGTTSFADLQASFQEGARHPLSYFVFDLLHVNGRNPRGLALAERKAILQGVLGGGVGSVHYSEHLEGDGVPIFHRACELHAEGIISKRADRAYAAGRTADWLKSKCLHEQEFVVGGFTYSKDGNDRIGSLLLGYYEGGKLVYAGRTGTGFTQKTKRAIREQVRPLEVKETPFARPPAEAKKGAIWVRPELVAQVRFATWTGEGFVRQAAFLGMREDKNPREVRREEPTTAPKPKDFEARGGGAARAASTAASAPGSSAGNAAAKLAAKPPAKAGSAAAPPVRLTHPDKVLDEGSGLTKRELAEYYWAVADRMLPHIADRPLSLVRCPEGAGKPCFFQKHVNHMLPKGIGSVDVPDLKTGKTEPYITLDSPEALAGLAQMGVLEVHPWGSRNEDLEHPDRLIFDLDPDESLAWMTVCEAAAEVRQRLKKMGLESFLKTTGGKGLHIVAPIEPELDWDAVKDLAHRFVLAMERSNPRLYLTKMTKAARTGKIYLDYLRNGRGATAVAPFSPRARLGTHVSLPLPWTALKLAERPVFAVHTFAEWRGELRKDPWKGMAELRQRLDAAKLKAL